MSAVATRSARRWCVPVEPGCQPRSCEPSHPLARRPHSSSDSPEPARPGHSLRKWKPGPRDRWRCARMRRAGAFGRGCPGAGLARSPRACGDRRRRAGPADPQRLPAVRRPRFRLLRPPARNHRTTIAGDEKFTSSPHQWCIWSSGGICAAREEPPSTGFRLCRRSVSGLGGRPAPRGRRSANSARHTTPRSGPGSCRAQETNLTSNRQSRIAGLSLTASPTSLAFPTYSTESKQVSS